MFIFCLHLYLTGQNKDKKPNQGSLEDLSQDQPDQALLTSEPINILRRSPMIRNRKTGSMEVPRLFLQGPGTTTRSHGTRPSALPVPQVLSETSPTQACRGCTSHRLFHSCSRQSPEVKPASGLGGHLSPRECV